MAFFGLTCGMVLGALASFVGCFVYGMPLWMGLVTYSMVGAVTTGAVVMTLYMRRNDDDAGGMPRFDYDEGDAEWMEALRNAGTAKGATKVA